MLIEPNLELYIDNRFGVIKEIGSNGCIVEFKDTGYEEFVEISIILENLKK